MDRLSLMKIFIPLFLCIGIGSAEPAIRDEISYSNDIAPVVKNFCTTCHAGDDPEGDMVLTSYEEVRKHTEEGVLLDRINDRQDPMPEDGLMPKYMRRLFKLWADSGYLKKGARSESGTRNNYQKFDPPTIAPIDVTHQGFDLLVRLQGHWVGPMNLLGSKYDWMAFDYRPISPSHIHGIFEGGTIGNLFTSFFVADFKGTKTIMARNGGLLNGIYRTSYFVLDKVEQRRKQTYYRLVDACGGEKIMYMELTFSGDSMDFNAYTSRFGLKEPKLHMAFKAKRKRPELAATAAKAVGFPKNIVDFKFPDPAPIPTWADEYPLTSASYLCEDSNADLVDLAIASKDPLRIDQIPWLARLSVKVNRTEQTKAKKLHVYLSQKALTDIDGKFIKRGRYIRMDLLDTLLSFPELSGKTDAFTFTYLHPGTYFLTVIADMDGDGYPSPGDISHPQQIVEVEPESHSSVTISNLSVQN